MKKILNKILATVIAASTIASTAALTGCGIDFHYCAHKLEEVPAVESTCVSYGKNTAYKCEKCGQIFAYGYLNGKDGEKGLYEIEHQEVSTRSGHSVSDLYGEIEGDKVTSLADYKVWSHCATDGCGEIFLVNEDELIPFAPSDNLAIASHETLGEDGKTEATKFAVPKGTAAGTKYIIQDGNDSGLKRATYKVPFAANVERDVVLFFHNDGVNDVDVKYGAEYYGETWYTEVTVPAQGYASATLKIISTQTAESSYHELYIQSNVTKDFNLTVSGYYYHGNKLSGVKAEEYKLSYARGDKFDLNALSLTAKYGTDERRIFPEDCQFILDDGRAITEPLMPNNEAVLCTYKTKTTKLSIDVQVEKHKLTLVGAYFANGGNTMEVAKNDVVPNAQIVGANGAEIIRFEDKYGNEFKFGESVMGGNDTAVRAIYKNMKWSYNLALAKVVTDNHGKNYNYASVSSHLVDGVIEDAGNHWSSDKRTTSTLEVSNRCWVQIDLGYEETITRIAVYPRYNVGYFPKGYFVEISVDGTNWITVAEETNDIFADDVNYNNPRMFDFPATEARYIRMTATELTRNKADRADLGYIFQLGEVEVFNLISIG